MFLEKTDMAQSEQSNETYENKINKFDGRILRNRHYKRPFADNRPVKRLFTPEIKRHLKTWLIRRRENPYPSREEKMKLASQTGLTYIQICNWFANWRRKLKKSGKNISKFNWGALIKSYNDQALGNVEHLSISSDDSIWAEPDSDQSKQNEYNQISKKNRPTNHSYSLGQSEKTYKFSEVKAQSSSADGLHQCFQISSTTDFLIEPSVNSKNEKKLNLIKKSTSSQAKTFQNLLDKNKKHKRDKNWNYKRMVQDFRVGTNFSNCSREPQTQKDPFLLSKWRKSVSFFQPDFNIYSNISHFNKKRKAFYEPQGNIHGREELDAAEALTFLSRAKQF